MMANDSIGPPQKCLHTSLRSLLESNYGVPRNQGRVVIAIEDGKPLEIRSEHVERATPDYATLVSHFAVNRLEQATPSPFKSIPNSVNVNHKESDEESPPWD